MLRFTSSIAQITLDFFHLSICKMWSLAQNGHHWGACEKCRLLGPSPGLLSQNLRFSKTPRGSVGRLKFQEHAGSSTWFHGGILYGDSKHRCRMPSECSFRSRVAFSTFQISSLKYTESTEKRS